MEENNDIIFSKKIRAGRRTYFIDVKPTRTEDYYITLTESKKRFRRSGGHYYEKHKVFLYKEDFNKFLNTLTEVIEHVKTELMPDYDFTLFDRTEEEMEGGYHNEYTEGDYTEKEDAQVATSHNQVENDENYPNDDDVEDEVRSHLQWD